MHHAPLFTRAYHVHVGQGAAGVIGGAVAGTLIGVVAVVGAVGIAIFSIKRKNLRGTCVCRRGAGSVRVGL